MYFLSSHFYIFLIPSYFCNLSFLLLLHLIFLTRNNICAYWKLGKLIPILEVDSKIFREVLKPLLDVKLGKNIFRLDFNRDEDSPIQKRAKINFNCE